MLTKLRTPEQNKRLFGLLNQVGRHDEDSRHELAYIYSVGRTTSTSQLYETECEELIISLKNQADKMRSHQEMIEKEAMNTMRRKIIHYAHLMGWKTPDAHADVERINNWCIKSGIYHKAFNSHSHDELIRLLNQFEKMYKSYLNNL